ncbi:Thiol:disulfide interchange protein TlpA [Novipirellula artificiosorum]|uniref:Thiol:disulfide interchange protein TlpA n=2 Tax=Novipirellula artificiosorum TaxID=2528016 RepID=A0A5C6DKM6_9BACT|nr:Thiol:disulfide interchange protein TlpA [Novipirellula artificiosorum]
MVPVILVAGLVFVSRTKTTLPSGQDSAAIGESAPELDLLRLTSDPDPITLEQLVPGKVTLIHFWGTWCGPCKMEYPHLSETVAKLEANPQFEFVSISCESGSSETYDHLKQKTYEFLNKIQASTEVYADPYGVTRSSAAERMQQSAMYFPTSMLVDQEGIIRGVWQGYAPEAVAEMEAAVMRLLSERT